MLSIMCFIIWKSSQNGLKIQKYLYIIESFLSQSMMAGIAGYYWSVAQAAVNYLANI